MLYPALQPYAGQKVTTEQFLGLDRRPRTNDGAFCAMRNMSGDPWPLMCSRKRRGLVATLTNPQGIISNNGLYWIDGTTLYKDGTATAITHISTATGMQPKRLVSMGAYILIFPDKLYYNTVDAADYGSMERLWTQSGDVTFQICQMDGTEYPSNRTTVDDEPPEEPENGDLWIDTTDSVHVLRQYRADTDEWMDIVTVYVKISGTNIGKGLGVQDGVEISGISYTGENTALESQLKLLNAKHVIQAAGDDYIIVIGLLDSTYTQSSGIQANRRIPAMDFMVECGNRLWGCRAGKEGSETLNEIYASALGDFKNFYKFQGTSQDSYTVAVGSEGPFTGAIKHNSQPYFFKGNVVHKIFGEKPSNYQMQNAVIDGVKAGCGATLQSINNCLYYVGEGGVQMMESLPMDVGKALGDEKIVAGCAGENDGKYYLSAKSSANLWSLYVMDTERGLWYREDESQALGFAKADGEIYMLCADGRLWALGGTRGTLEDKVQWWAESAVMGYETANHLYIGRFDLRAKMQEGARLRLLIQYDGEGAWEEKGSLQWQKKARSYVLPVIPRRCDTLKIKIMGEGEAQLYGLTRTLKYGADGQHKGKVNR